MPTAVEGPACGTGAFCAGKSENEENRTVKRTAFLLAGIIALGTVGFTGNSLRADPQLGDANMAVRPKLAIINLQQCIKSYAKWKAFEEAYKDYYDRYNKAFEKKKDEGLKVKGNLEKATDDVTKETLTKQLKEIERQIQDLGEEAKKNLGKYRDEQTVQMYKEVEEAVAAYARANDIQIVMQYNDPTSTPAEQYHPANIQRKFQNGGCLPMYVQRGLDITDVISANLNQRLGIAPAPATGGQPMH
jgi:Skp family chaperone for outer membrane proteins